MSRPILPLPDSASAQQQASQTLFASPARLQHRDGRGDGGDGGSGGGKEPSKTTYTKRGKITIVACVPCRRRKTKCDGTRPVCSQCQARDGNCLYDMTDDQRRLTYLRDNVEQLAEEKNNLEALVSVIKSANDADVAEVVRRLREQGDIRGIAQHVQAGRVLNEVRGENTPSTSSESRAGTSASRSPQTENIQSTNSMETLLRLLATSSRSESEDIVRRLHQNQDYESIVASVQALPLLQPIDSCAGEPSIGPEVDFAQDARKFGLVKGVAAEEQNQPLSRAPAAHTPLVSQERWTTVTDDQEFIEHLISLYFAWQHVFFQSVPERLFRKDLRSGNTRFCSKMLVNAICAAGCLFSRRPEARQDPDDPRTAGLAFYNEAVRLLNESYQSSLPTAAALFLLCHIESNRGRFSAVWSFCGRSARMALDINLHLRSDMFMNHSNTEAMEEEIGRWHCFWGCFIGDQVISFTLGRLPQIPTTAITVDLPPISDEDDTAEWIAYDVDKPRRPAASSTCFNRVASLSKIVNSTSMMFFAPSQTMSGSLLLTEYQKYLDWYENLPDIVKGLDGATPHVLCMHMYYHAAVLLLFRPFLKAKFTESSVSPREVCRDSANKISDIFALHRRHYDLFGIFTFQTHCLLTACAIHIINVPTISATRYLVDACNIFQHLVHHNDWAKDALNILRGLVRKWNIILPCEAEEALYRGRDADEYPSSYEFNIQGGQADVYRPEKRPASLNPSSQVMHKRIRVNVSSTTAPQHGRNPADPAKMSRSLAPTQQLVHAEEGGTSDTSGQPRTRQRQPPQRSLALEELPPMTTEQQEQQAQRQEQQGGYQPPPPRHQQQSRVAPHGTTTYLFTPFPNQPAPLLGPIHTSTNADTGWNDELNKVSQDFDGLNFENFGDEWFDPFMGYQANDESGGMCSSSTVNSS